MIILSNICIIMIVTFFLFVVSIRFIEFAIAPSKVGTTSFNVLITILFILLLGAVMPRLGVWLF